MRNSRQTRHHHAERHAASAASKGSVGWPGLTSYDLFERFTYTSQQHRAFMIQAVLRESNSSSPQQKIKRES